MSITKNQPTNFNLSTPLNFKMEFARLPDVEFFIQRVSVPSMVIGELFQPTSFIEEAEIGDKLTFDQLTLGVQVDEELKNYEAIYNWMVGLAFPEEFAQWTALADSPDGLRSDASLHILSNSQNPIVTLNFKDLHPVLLGSLDYDASLDANPIIIDIGFKFSGVYTIDRNL